MFISLDSGVSPDVKPEVTVSISNPRTSQYGCYQTVILFMRKDNYQFYWPMCSSRKHPYPPDGGHFFFRPPTPLRFPFQGVLVVPPTSWNFRDFPSFGNLLEKASKTSRKLKYLIGTKFCAFRNCKEK